MRRFYDDQPFSVDTPAQLGEAASHHIARVLRMQVNDELVVFNGQGGEWLSRITAIGKRHVEVQPLKHQPEDRCSMPRVHLALPLIKGDRMDYALQKATELGAASFQLITTERTEMRLDPSRLEKKLPHWQQVIISACEQCGLNRLPALRPPVLFTEYLASANGPLKLIAHPGEQPVTMNQLAHTDEIHLATGPEGGFSNSELAQAQQNGFQSFALGPRVLRAETAPVALLAAIWMACDGQS
jgi:16S rRNA (uracil1498-N3)-methyltransferase